MTISKALTAGGLLAAVLALGACHPAHYGHRGHHGIYHGGVDSDAIDVKWYGEMRPRVATADGVREAQNRRVEIRFDGR